MFSKLVLPLLGGSSNVWNTAMVFFQSMLLLGYVYAHLISKYLDLKFQIITHISLLLVGLLFLPLSISLNWVAPTEGTPIFWLLGLFTVSIGVPFFAISANAPLFQSWFSKTTHQHAADPYFLYAASNAGSLLTLCAYPVFIEPNLLLDTQTSAWTMGYGLLILMILVCGGLSVFNRVKSTENEAAPISVNAPANITITLKTALFWILLAFIPSSLMLGVTSYMTNNIASAPFLWIIPLALYLLTFVIVFMRRPIIKFTQLAWLFPTIVITAIYFPIIKGVPHVVSIIVALTSYFLIALYCHSRLVEARPQASKLTQFYIFMSLGGVLGGVFNALVAPMIFNDIYEYVLILWLAGCVIAVTQGKPKIPAVKSIYTACAYAIIGLASVFLSVMFMENAYLTVLFLVIGFSFVITRHLGLSSNSILFHVASSIVLVYMLMSSEFVHKERSFYSTIKVKVETKEGVSAHAFLHGDTVHNYQLIDDEHATIPLAYYAEGNTFDQVIDAVRELKPNLDIAVIGLGAGAMACFETPADNWTYFEIDPAVVKMAKNTELFSYLDRCSPNADIRIGDARLTIQDLEKGSQDIIVVDAFSSDSIPVHLVTREALAIYREYLKEDGVIFFHTSNRVMDVSSVVARLADDIGWEKQLVSVDSFESHPFKQFIHSSSGVLIGPKPSIDALKDDKPDWNEFEAHELVKLWTDDYSSILGPIRAFH
jgi:spermidine synthase